MSCFRRSKRQHAGFTLIEILVALGIASLLTLIALPAARNAIRSHSSSRTADMVRQVFVNARAQAIRSNRPFGVTLQRVGTTGAQADYCQKLGFVSTPPLYRGDVVGATAVKRPALSGDGVTQYRFWFSQDECGRLWFETQNYTTANPIVQRRLSLRPGSTISFGNNTRPFFVSSIRTYSLTHPNRTAAGNRPGVELLVDFGLLGSPGLLPAFVNGSTHDFEMQGLPQDSFLPGAELPRDNVIDLSISGFGLNGVQFNSEAIRANTSVDGDAPDSLAGFNRIVVLFGPSGNIQRVYSEAWNSSTVGYDVLSQPVVGSIYLGVGRADGVLRPEEYGTFDTADEWKGTEPNFASTETVWITLRTSSGTVGLSPQVSPLQNAAAFYAAHGISAPPTGTNIANRVAQMNVLQLRVTRGRELAKQGALLQ